MSGLTPARKIKVGEKIANMHFGIAQDGLAKVTRVEVDNSVVKLESGQRRTILPRNFEVYVYR